MIFYIAYDENGHKQLRGTQADAKAVNRNFEQIDIPTDKAGLMAFVQELYAEIDATPELSDDDMPLNRGGVEECGFLPEPAPVKVSQESYAARSVRFDEEFDKFPLALQLHYAAVAMENARDQLPSVVPGPRALVSHPNVADLEVTTG